MHYILSALAAALTSVMILVNGELSARYDVYTAAVIIHIVGLLLITIIARARRERLFAVAGLKWTLFLGGAIGVLTTVFCNLSYGQIDVSAIVALNLLGQTVTALLIDQLGLFGMPVRRMNGSKLIGLAFCALGILAMLLGKTVLALPVVLSLLTGVTIAVARSINAQLARRTSMWVSTWYNYVVGLAVMLLVWLAANQLNYASLPTALHPPAWLYLGGVIGVIIVMQANFSTHKLPAFQMTLVLFMGQLLAGVAIDAARATQFPLANLIGGLLVTAGLCLNVWMDARRTGGR